MDVRFSPAIGSRHIVVAFAALPLFATSASGQFFAAPTPGGELVVTDGGGVEVEALNGDPVGTRPEICPVGAYYFSELATDKAQMVLMDCATGEGAFTVEFQAE